ncbi:helix-turn-helix domain-containing protein [Bradyrhizobium elkanii]|uniref:helix-turn-helix domain-containing protein n=1 Tax=Bradyrhizobium elkanii TaxID=29448 RepID=UPI000425BA86|nr:helix-turn-helix domain-containing protein [Bradyrhizobium elkanii]
MPSDAPDDLMTGPIAELARLLAGNRIGDRIKAVRLGRKLHADQIAERLNMSRNALSTWETGAVENIPISKLIKFAEMTKVSLDWLLTGSGPPPDFANIEVPAGAGKSSLTAATMTTLERRPTTTEAHNTAIDEAYQRVPEVNNYRKLARLITNWQTAQFSVAHEFGHWMISHTTLEKGLNCSPTDVMVMRVVASWSEGETKLERGDYAIVDQSRTGIDNEPGVYLQGDADGANVVWGTTQLPDKRIIGRVMAVVHPL